MPLACAQVDIFFVRGHNLAFKGLLPASSLLSRVELGLNKLWEVLGKPCLLFRNSKPLQFLAGGEGGFKNIEYLHLHVYLNGSYGCPLIL